MKKTVGFIVLIAFLIRFIFEETPPAQFHHIINSFCLSFLLAGLGLDESSGLFGCSLCWVLRRCPFQVRPLASFADLLGCWVMFSDPLALVEWFWVLGSMYQTYDWDICPTWSSLPHSLSTLLWFLCIRTSCDQAWSSHCTVRACHDERSSLSCLGLVAIPGSALQSGLPVRIWGRWILFGFWRNCWWDKTL